MSSQLLGCARPAAFTTKRLAPPTGGASPRNRRAPHLRATPTASMTPHSNNDGTIAATKGGRLDPSKAVVFVCDVQERFRGVIDGFSHCVYVSSTMMRAAAILDVPIVVTEQYPERHGDTIKSFRTPPGHHLPAHLVLSPP